MRKRLYPPKAAEFEKRKLCATYDSYLLPQIVPLSPTPYFFKNPLPFRA